MAREKQWIRLYTGIPDDPKAQRLPGDMFKFWINCLCLAGRNDGWLPQPDDIAFHLHCSRTHVDEQILFLAEAGLLEKADTGIRPHNWAARQFEECDSAERMRRFRERRRHGRIVHDVTLVTGCDEMSDGPVTLDRSVTTLSTIQYGASKKSDGESDGDVTHKCSALLCSVYKNQEAETETVSRAGNGFDVAENGFDVESWADALYAQHPKKKDRRLVEIACHRVYGECLRLGIDPESKFQSILKIHGEWCQSEQWTKQNSQFCPQLALWLDDDGYTAKSPRESLNGNDRHQSRQERILAEALRRKNEPGHY